MSHFRRRDLHDRQIDDDVLVQCLGPRIPLTPTLSDHPL
jgi:hypothetical protein